MTQKIQTPRNVFLDNFRIEIRAAIAKATAAGIIDHSGLKGHVREIFAADLLKLILPPSCGIIHGKITDRLGSTSAECDLIVYSHDIFPALLFNQVTGIAPIESSLYAFEIKSEINANEIDDAIEKFKRLSSLLPLKGDHYPHSVLFGFKSSIVEGGKDELDRYLERDNEGQTNPAVSIICIVGKGYWYFQRHEQSGGQWNFFRADSNFSEISDFLGGIANTIPATVRYREGAAFGQYLVRENIVTKI